MRILLSLSIIAVLTSCRGRSTAQITLSPISHSIARGDTVKALGRNLMVVFQDSKQQYWFGSWEDGLYRYDGKTILHFTTKDGLPHNRIEEIKEDSKGNLYINTSTGVCRYDGTRFTTLPVISPALSAWKLEADELWFRCVQDGGQVYRYDGQFLHRLQLPETPVLNAYLAKHPATGDTRNSPYAVYTLYKDTRGYIWFGTAVLGVCRYDGQSFDWITEEDVTELHDGPANGVRAIIEDAEGYFWFNSRYRYKVFGDRRLSTNDTIGQAFQYSREISIGSLDGKANSPLTEYLSIVKDKQGALWIATYRSGVWRYDGKAIAHYVVKDGSKESTIFSIYQDRAGQLWLGTEATGVYRFNGKAFEPFRP
jgi:ligand-binding sensor domain-containing protein